MLESWLEACLKGHIGEASGDGRSEQRMENGKASGERVGQETQGTMKMAISESKGIENGWKKE